MGKESEELKNVELKDETMENASGGHSWQHEWYDKEPDCEYDTGDAVRMYGHGEYGIIDRLYPNPNEYDRNWDYWCAEVEWIRPEKKFEKDIPVRALVKIPADY